MDFDWDAIEDWFIHNSGDMSYVQVSEQSSRLPCFGYKSCSAEKIREIAKRRLFMQKRAEYQAEQHGGIIDDYRRAYEIVTKTIGRSDTDDGKLSASELASLGALQLKYGEAIMALNPPSRDSDIEILTRDDVLRIAQKVMDGTIDFSQVDPLDLMAEETPGAERMASGRTDQIQH